MSVPCTPIFAAIRPRLAQSISRAVSHRVHGVPHRGALHGGGGHHAPMFGPPRPPVVAKCIRPSGALPAGPGAPGGFGSSFHGAGVGRPIGGAIGGATGGVVAAAGAGGLGAIAKAALIAGGLGLAGVGLGGYAAAAMGGVTSRPATIEQSGAYNPSLPGGPSLSGGPSLASVTAPGGPLSPAVDVGGGSGGLSPDMMLPEAGPETPAVEAPEMPGETDQPAAAPETPSTAPDADADTSPENPVSVPEPSSVSILAALAAIAVASRAFGGRRVMSRFRPA